MPEWMPQAIVTAAAGALVTWGAIRVELRYLRRDVDRAHLRLDNLPCGQYGRRATDCTERG